MYLLLARHDIATFPVARMHFGHSIAFVALIFWIVQITTGFMLLGILSYNLEIQYNELISVCLHGNFVWLTRALHMLGANFAVISVLVHMGKAITYSRVVSAHKAIIWLVGAAIFLLSLATAFTGYVVVSGNMSFWAALVILNLLTVIPVLGNEIVSGILAGSTVTSWAVRRFTVIHFLLALVSFALVLAHVVLLHRQAPSRVASDCADGVESLAVVLTKDLAITFIFFWAIFGASVKTLIHPDNWQAFSRLATPAHIEPEIYFLWTFSAIKLHNGKVVGVAFLARSV